MNKPLIILLLWSLPITIHAQDYGERPLTYNTPGGQVSLNEIARSNWEIGIRSGINFFKTRFDVNINVDPVYLPGYSVNAVVKYGGNGGVAFQAEPGYLSKNNQLVIPGDSQLYFTYQLNYLNLPFLLRYQGEYVLLFDAFFQQTYLITGLEFNILQKGTAIVEKEGIDYGTIYDISDDIHEVEASLIGGVGSSILITSSSTLILEARLINGLSDYDNMIRNIKMTHFGFQVMAGLSTHL